MDPQLIEAGIVAGCTRRQLFTKIRLPLAMPEIMLGINQTVMMALALVVLAGRYTGYRLTELRRFKELSGS